MPNPLVNLWSCNTWQEDPQEQAASTVAIYGPEWDPSKQSASGTEAPVPEPAPTPTPESRHQQLVADWPDIAAVVVEHFNGESDEMETFWREHWKKKDNPLATIQCFDKARWQVHLGGFDIIPYYRPDSTTYQVFTEAGGINEQRTAEAIAYVKTTLQKGVPVLTGILLTTFNRRPNSDKTTNHYIVTVGMGTDETGHFFTCFDYMNKEADKYYFKENFQIEQEFGFRKVTQFWETAL